MKTTTGVKHLTDVWVSYAHQLLALNPEWWGRYKYRVENYYIYRKVSINGKLVVECIFSYDKFKAVIDEFFIAAKEVVIQGDAVNLGNHIGKICARRVERDHNNRQVNWEKTNQQDKIWNVKKGKFLPKKIIYFTDDDYCRIGLHKTGRIKNETVYEFKPSGDNRIGTGFSQEFAKRLRQNTLLKFKYLYYPLFNNREKNKTTVAS